MFTFISVSLNFKIHLLNNPVHAQGTFFFYTFLYSDTEINIIIVANSNPKVISSGRLNNAVTYRSTKHDLRIRIRHCTWVPFNIVRVIKSRRVN
jgi:hypothetical protein